jgi:hypothetical protein
MLPSIIATLTVVQGVAGAAWTVQRTVAPQTNQAQCHLKSDVMTLNDGYQDIKAFVRIHQDALQVNTEAPLDTSFSDIGLQVDKNDFILMDSVSSRQAALFTDNYARLIQQFKQGRRVRVQLRFWPTWPTTGTHSVSFSLIGFSKAYTRMQTCSE